MYPRAVLLVSVALLVSDPSPASEEAIANEGVSENDGWTSFEFEAYNREYVDIRTSTSWERQGPIDATLTSPAHRLSVRDHTVDLRPARDGGYEARVRVNFSGEGDVIAEIGVAGAETLLEDHVTAPQQEIEVDARLDFRRVEGGYEIETLELQRSVEVEIESQLGRQIVQICDSALAFFGVDCGSVEAMFSSATVDLPTAGATYFISDDRLSKGERARLDRFLEVKAPEDYR